MRSPRPSSRHAVGRLLTGLLLALPLLAACGGEDDDPPLVPTVAAESIPAPALSPLASPTIGAGAVAFDRADPARTGAFPGPAPAGPPLVRWRADVGFDVGVAPVVAGGVIYAVGRDLRAYDEATGAQLWKADIDAESAVAVAHGLVFIGGQWQAEPALFALDAATGEERWRFSDDCASSRGSSTRVCNIGGTPLVIGDLVVFGSPSELVALDAATGAERWRVEADWLFSTAASADSVVYATAGSERVYAVDAGTGQKLWDAKVRKRMGPPVIAGGRIFVTSAEQHAIALDAATGAQVWSVSTDGDPTQPAVAGDLVLIGSRQADRLLALDAATGDERWRLDLDDPIYAPPSIAGDLVFVSAGDEVLAVDAATGVERWRVGIGDLSTAAVAVAAGVVFAGSHDDHLYAIGGS